MLVYPVADSFARSYSGSDRLVGVAQLIVRPFGETAAAVAQEIGVSRAHLYRLQGRAQRSLDPRRPGPPPGWRERDVLQQQVAELHAKVDTLQQQLAQTQETLSHCVEVTTRGCESLELILRDHHVPLRGIQEAIGVAFGPQHRPRLADLDARLHRHGQLASQLLAEGRRQVARNLPVLTGDDIFFHRHPVKVVAEPRSVAILNLGRWESHTADDWQLWLEEYINLKLLVSDLGTDLVGAASGRGLAQQADLFHEKRWFDRQLLTPLSRHEAAARRTFFEALERATRTKGPGRRLAPEKVAALEQTADDAQDEFLTTVMVLDQVWTLFEAINPATGRLWTSRETAVTLQQVIRALSALRHPAARRAVKHLRRHGHRYSAYLGLFDCIQVHLRPNSTWVPRTVLNATLRLWQMKQQLEDLGAWSDYADWKVAWRSQRELSRRLEQECLNLEEVCTALRRELAYPKRSSSAIESRWRPLEGDADGSSACQ